MNKAWTPSSWRSHPIAQAPIYKDLNRLAKVEKNLARLPALVFDGEVRQLREQLASVERGEAFLLQGGDCAESFADLTTEKIRDNFKVHLQMAIALIFGAKKPVIKIGRVAGQFAKPRSSDDEVVNGITLPTYRGDILNSHEASSEGRSHSPERMERAYFHSAATLNLLRAYSKGGFADLHRIHSWNLEFAKHGSRYFEIVSRLKESLDFIRAAGLPLATASQLESIEFFTSHEALLLNYEEALVRSSDITGEVYAGSAHMLWIGERTRNLDGAHIEFARGISNPIGLKCGPDIDLDELLKLIDRLNPKNESGRLTLIPRLGVKKVGDALPKLIRKIKDHGRKVVWCCDPMHGNTYMSPQKLKTRSFDDIINEVRSFFEIHKSEGTHAGGVHLEFTGQDVIECTGGAQKIAEKDLTKENYQSLCDPRLNASQSLELVFQLVEHIHSRN